MSEMLHLMDQSEISQEFAEQISSGELAFYHIDAVPRSMSTILSIVLLEAGRVDDSRTYVQTDEPLNWSTRHLGFGIIADRVLGLKEDDEPTTVFEKSTARNVYPSTFEDICRFAGGVIFTVRHPEKQMYSLSQRIINDQMYGKGSGDVINLNEFGPAGYRSALSVVDKFLQVSGHHDRGEWPVEEVPYMQPSWREILSNYRYAKENKIPMVVVDGTSLTLDPKTKLMGICETLNLPYSPTMLRGWSSDKDEFHKDHTNWPSRRTEEGAFANGWLLRATSTDAILDDITPALDMSACPPRMLEYIEKVAIPAYEELTAHPNSNTRADNRS